MTSGRVNVLAMGEDRLYQFNVYRTSRSGSPEPSNYNGQKRRESTLARKWPVVLGHPDDRVVLVHTTADVECCFIGKHGRNVHHCHENS
ncbi:hypothetical protein Trydic_g9581 [Trypoxylus dichotomus]